MVSMLGAAVARARATVIILLMLIVGGLSAFLTIPKESNPDIAIPLIYISVSHEGIAPEDSERLLLRPLEQELTALEGLKEMRGIAAEGYGSIVLEFQAGFDADQALTDVREQVDLAKTKLPEASEEPVIEEINVSQFPVLNVSLSGPYAEGHLIAIARQLKRLIESIPEVLSVDIGGDREDLLELVADPQVLERYGIDQAQLFNLISNNNQLVAAGNIDTGAGRMVIKVPGLLEDVNDLLSMPVKQVDGRVITFAQVATVQRTYKDPQGFARIDGQPALVLEISKRAGANIIETIAGVKQVIELSRQQWPVNLQVNYITDESIEISDMLNDLLNNVLFAVILVMLVVLSVMGIRPALLVGMTIPGAFLTGILVLETIGFTLNIVVLFSLILVAGMLVDGAIVVAELADRNLRSGYSGVHAYTQAAQRMSWPIIASTATTLAVFLPLLFWPGMVGEFMKFLPATVIICLLASLLMALVFLPVLGSIFGGSASTRDEAGNSVAENGHAAGDRAERDQAKRVSPLGRGYGALLAKLLQYPVKTLLMFVAIMMLIYVTYGRFNHGVEFFPDVEPDSAQVLVHARGDFSVYEKDRLLKLVEERLAGMAEVREFYARSLGQTDSELGEDVIGLISFQFVDWAERRTAVRLFEEMRARTGNLPLLLEFRKQEDGPTQAKPIKIRVSGAADALIPAVDALRQQMAEVGGFVDITDNRPLPGIEWRIEVNREEAARYGVDIATVGNVVQLVTNGLLLADYRPDDAEEEVDIRLRLPLEYRNLDALTKLMLTTPEGVVPLANFTSLVPTQKTGTLQRVDTQRTLTIDADVEEGVQVNERLSKLKEALQENPLANVVLSYAGEDEDQRETMVFLINAFLIAVALMALILVIQFNSIYQAIIVLSAIVFSTAGVLIGLLVTGRPFGIVMVGLGLIALAGIVVNNNIILIDTYNRMLRSGATPYKAALETGKLRLRPVLLTAMTTVLGLIPMMSGINVDLITPRLGIGAPSTQWWTQLSSAIAGGLTFATFLTLLITPCLLVAFDNLVLRWQQKKVQTVGASASKGKVDSLELSR